MDVNVNGLDYGFDAGSVQSITVSGASGSSSLTINDNNTASGHTYTLTATTFSRAGAPTITYTNFPNAVVNCGNFNNTIDWQGCEYTQVNTGTGNNTINVGDANNTLDGFQGIPLLDGQGGTNIVNINDQGSSSPHTYAINGSTISRDGVPEGYANVAKLTLNGSSGADTYEVGSTPAQATVLHGGSGTNLLIGPDANSLWQINAANGGVLGMVTFSSFQSLAGGSGNDTFQFTGAGSISGTVNGGPGPANELDYSGDGGVAATVNLQFKSCLKDQPWTGGRFQQHRGSGREHG